MTSSDSSRRTVGAWSMLGAPAAAAALAGIGADWVLLDAQHGLYDDRSILDTVARLAAMRTGHPTLVRVPANDAAWIGRALDAGADGVVVPMIRDAADAAKAAAAVRYAPDGTRSWGPMSAYWGGAGEDAATANGRVTCNVMIETPGALAEVESIAATPGVDMLFVGPFDLSIALGTTHAELLADTSPESPLRRIVAAARAAGIRSGAYGGTLEAAAALYGHGFDDVAVVVDTAVLTAAGADSVERARNL
ncbi:HpcH/HpaI aldolase/citrate lyase family protein [Herbiconiux sp. L3-i23]|uniref:HpcH/HpaI aldolase family protein n=1 Tax=Herbiconiux sp. L3-i23 TaxID=2905871 RepID=UPI0020603B1F|nr:aldolase/citrate lyase family protein [Herbiconiux sp. L3-i23]BDI21871.1 2-dehydro-3-deoxyglucarate aldolase [Herbiconiux sp. L3-i23]